MGARTRLNSMHLLGSLGLAFIAGIVTRSFGVGITVFVAITLIDLISGNVRPRRRGRR